MDDCSICVSLHICREQQPTSRTVRGAAGSNKKGQAPNQARVQGSQHGASNKPKTKKLRKASASGSPEANMRGSKPRSTKVPSSPRPMPCGTDEQAHNDLAKSILQLVDVVEGMEASIADLQTANTRQAKELVRQNVNPALCTYCSFFIMCLNHRKLDCALLSVSTIPFFEHDCSIAWFAVDVTRPQSSQPSVV